MPFSFSPDLSALTNPLAWWMPLAAVAGVVLDRLLGEPRYLHPLVGFGKFAAALERALNRGEGRITSGALAWAVAVLPWVMLALWGRRHDLIGWLLDVILLYLALGGRSLAEHAGRVAADLERRDLSAARRHVGLIVSRDCAALDESGVAKACVESTLENGNDAIFGTLFWFALFGGAGAVLYRLANTLDAMWGYKTERYLQFGRAAARIDDVLNFVPARLTALSFALVGRTRRAFACWRAQAPAWESPNAGPVMAAGAGSLGLTLGGTAIYHGRSEERPPLGEGSPPAGADIARALTLVRRSIALWLAIFFIATITKGFAGA